MSETASLLALDAALTASKNSVPEHLTKELKIWLDEIISDLHPNFGRMLDAQKEAVEELARNTQVFGR